MKKIILTREEIFKIEQETEEKYGIKRLILMENAGRQLAEVIKENMGNFDGKKIFIFCGKGNNGGDGFVAARYLFNWNAEVEVYYLGNPENYTEISSLNFNILNKMGIKTISLAKSDIYKLKYKEADLVVDAILGTGIKGEVRGEIKELIDMINKESKRIVSADIPSGLDANTGKICGVCIRADITVSFGFGKKGFYINDGPTCCGEIKIVDIGFPKFFYERK